MRAAQDFASRRDVPDVLGFEDYAGDPVATYDLVRQRLADDALFMDKRLFPLPKSAGGTRGLTIMNPVDEFALRAYVGRCSSAILNATYSHRVLNGLIRRPGPAWFSADFREQIRRRRDLLRFHRFRTARLSNLSAPSPRRQPPASNSTPSSRSLISSTAGGHGRIYERDRPLVVL